VRRTLLKIWRASQPILRQPRRWTAKVLRSFLRQTTFIAITGSNGKSTATRYLAAILSSQAPTQWTRLNRNSDAGITETIAFCKPWKTRYAVFEVAAGQPDAIRKSTRLINPHISVVLSVFLEHRALFKTVENVAREKAGLLAELPQDGVAVLNADDPLGARMHVPSGRKLIRCGASPDCDVYYENAISAWPDMLRFTAVVNGRRQEIRSRLLGTHWIGTLLACIAVADHLGVPLDQIARVIEREPPYPGRMQVLRLPTGAVIIRDEYKGSRHTIAAAFEELRKADARRKFLVLCDESESSLGPRKRLRKIGRRAAELVDYAIFIGDKAHHGVYGARLAGLAEDQAVACATYVEAAEFLNSMLRAGDVVLLKADRGGQLSRLFFSLLGKVRCTIPICERKMVCDDCTEFHNGELVHLANEHLTVGAG
jgi:UDP-N-acetylmuramoyl-tripeptide--D-alanyl-D-alanine ligase